ncbi:hypothetical protein BsWGS_06067 [Bradybaena similaris]
MAKQNGQRPTGVADNVMSNDYHWSHKLVFTGPGGVRDYRSHVADNAQAVGIGSASVEQTLDIGYVFRPAPGAPFERPRGLMPGEIGWGIPWLVDLGVPKPGEQLAVKK